MKLDSSTGVNRLYVCAADGWQYFTGNLYDNCAVQSTSFNIPISTNGVSGTLSCTGGYTKLMSGGCSSPSTNVNFRASYESALNTWTCMADNKSASVVYGVFIYIKCCK